MFMILTLFSNPYVLNRECEANNVINSLNCDGFDIGSRCSLNLLDLCRSHYHLNVSIVS